MKKLLLVVMVAILGFGCGEDTYVYETYEGYNMFSDVYVIKPKDWSLDGTEGGKDSFFYCEVNERRLTNDAYKKGIVVVYMVQSPGEDNEVQTPLAFGRPKGEGYGGDNWVEFYSYDYRPGSIAFYLEYSDFATFEWPKDELQFRVVVMWP